MFAPTQIQIFGERCSGTNYLEQLLRENLTSAEVKWDYGWKHFFHKVPIERENHCLFIVIYRNPFDWLRSLHRKPHHAAPELKRISFSQFIHKEWQCVQNENSGIGKTHPLYNTEMLFERDPDTGRRFANVMQLRSAKIRNWESLKGKAANTFYVNYEALLAHPQQHIDDIAEIFRIAKTPKFSAITSHKGKGQQVFKPKIYPEINPRDIDYIVRQLDTDLEYRIGYPIADIATRQRQQCPETRGVTQVLKKLFR